MSHVTIGVGSYMPEIGYLLYLNWMRSDWWDYLDIFQPTGPLYSGSFFLEPHINYSSRATHLLLGKIIQLSIICWARTYFIRQYDRGWVFIASKMWSTCLRTLILECINTNMAELILKMNTQVASCLPVSFFSSILLFLLSFKNFI